MTSVEESSTGLTPRVAAVLAYLAGPFSGVLVLLAERTSGFVRFHAWQSVLGLGALGLVVVMLLGLAFASLIVSAPGLLRPLPGGWTDLGCRGWWAG